MTEDEIKKAHEKLIDSGHLIEAGWEGLRLIWLHPESPQIQIDEMRLAFFAGAQHVYATIMHSMSDGEEATEEDLKRIENVQIELEAFYDDFVSKLRTKVGPQ